MAIAARESVIEEPVAAAETRRFRVGLFSAFPDYGNMGCNALTLSFLALVRRVRPDAEFVFLHRLRAPDSKVVEVNGEPVRLRLVNCRLTPRAALQQNLFWIHALALAYRLIPMAGFRRWVRRVNPWMDAVAGCDLLAHHFYGDSFSDIYGLGRLARYVACGATATVAGVPVTFLPQTYGPFRSRIARILARFALSRSGAVLARDGEGLDAARRMLGRRAHGTDVRHCPDMAFALPSTPPRNPAFAPPLKRGSEPIIGVNVSGLLWSGGYDRNNMFGLNEDYKRVVGELLSAFLRETPARILLIPHVYSDDLESDGAACREAFEALSGPEKSRVHLILDRYGPSELKGIIGLCDFFVGSRMHACIAALSQRIPAVGIAYSPKFSGVFASVGVGDLVIDARRATLPQIVAHGLVCYANRGAWRRSLEQRVPEAERLLADTFRKLCETDARHV